MTTASETSQYDIQFDAVYEQIVRLTADEVPIDAEDLPGYAVRLYDAHLANPEVGRLITWYRLERGAAALTTPLAVESTQAKVDAIRAAQAAGTVSSRFDASSLLSLVLHTAALWTTNEPLALDHDHIRDTIAEAVRLLVSP